MAGMETILPLLTGGGNNLQGQVSDMANFGLQAYSLYQQNKWQNKVYSDWKAQQEKLNTKLQTQEDQARLMAYPTSGRYMGSYYAMGGSKKAYGYGGSTNNVASNVEVASGATHEQGGINYDGATIEDDEVVLKLGNEDLIFSNRIPIGKETVASIAAKLGKIKGELEKQKGSKNVGIQAEGTNSRVLEKIKEVDTKLMELYKYQETYKEKAGLSNPQDRQQTQEQNQQVTQEGEEQAPVEQSFAWGGSNDPTIKIKPLPYGNKSPAKITYNPFIGKSIVRYPNTQAYLTPKLQLSSPISQKQSAQQVLQGTALPVTAPTIPNTSTKDSLELNTQTDTLLSTASAYMPHIANLMMLNKRPVPTAPTMNKAFVSDPYVNIQPQLTNIDTQTSIAKKNINSAVANSNIATSKIGAITAGNITAKNELYGNKENLEREIKNANVSNLQNTYNTNANKVDEFNDAMYNHVMLNQKDWSREAGDINVTGRSLRRDYNLSKLDEAKLKITDKTYDDNKAFLHATYNEQYNRAVQANKLAEFEASLTDPILIKMHEAKTGKIYNTITKKFE